MRPPLNDCRDCPRLAGFLDQVRESNPGYFCRPVPPFGDPNAALLIVGLAPGMHGANATGRPFTGDACSDLLYGNIFRCGLSTAPRSVSVADGLVLKNCRITNAVKCLPPDNKPTGSEVKTCGQFLKEEISSAKPQVILALGAVSHRAVLSALPLKEWGLKAAEISFSHGLVHRLPEVSLVDSYHPSRYNINTGRLTPEMFAQAMDRAVECLRPAR